MQTHRQSLIALFVPILGCIDVPSRDRRLADGSVGDAVINAGDMTSSDRDMENGRDASESDAGDGSSLPDAVADRDMSVALRGDADGFQPADAGRETIDGNAGPHGEADMVVSDLGQADGHPMERDPRCNGVADGEVVEITDLGPCMEFIDACDATGRSRRQVVRCTDGRGQAEDEYTDCERDVRLTCLQGPVRPIESPDYVAQASAGYAVAIRGDRALIGVPGIRFQNSMGGAALLERQVGGGWIQTDLATSGRDVYSTYGLAVAVGPDYLAVTDVTNDSPAVEVLGEGPAGTWSTVASLVPDGESVSFGRAIAVDDDNILASDEQNSTLGVQAGAVFVYTRDGGGRWSRVQKLAGMDTGPGNFFGHSVAINGSFLIVGARNDDDLGSQSGSAYVFEDVGGVWTERAKLLDVHGGPSHQFGTAVAIRGTIALVAAPNFERDDGGIGVVRVFEREGNGHWRQRADLVPLPDGEVARFGTRFGAAVALSESAALIGDPSRSRAYVFVRGPNGDWTQSRVLTGPDQPLPSGFGESVAIAGERAVIGAPRAVTRARENSGAAYIVDSAPAE